MTFEQIWETFPKRIRELPESSNMYRYYNTVFDVYLKDRAIPNVDFLKRQVFLDTAEGKYLDHWGDEANVKRSAGEEDDVYRERIRFKLLIDSEGLTIQAVQNYLFFRTGYEVEIQDEWDIAGRMLNDELLDYEPKGEDYLHSDVQTWRRWYISFWNVPPVNPETLYKVLRSIIEPYVRLILCPHRTGEAVARIVDAYCDNFSVYDINKEMKFFPVEEEDGSWMHSTDHGVRTHYDPNNERATLEEQSFQVLLNESPDSFWEEIKEDLQSRLPEMKIYMGFSNQEALIENYIDGTYEILGSEYDTDENIGYFIVPEDDETITIDVEGSFIRDPIFLKQEMRKQFGKDIQILDPVSKKAVEVISVDFELFYGSAFGGWVWSTGTVKEAVDMFDYEDYMVSESSDENIYIRLFESVSESEKESIAAELLAVNGNKNYVFV